MIPRFRPLSKTLAAFFIVHFSLCIGVAASSSEKTPDPFPKPDPAGKFPEFKLRDPANNNRPWRVAREDWEGARKRIATDPAWKKWLASERAEVGRWMARHRDRVEWTAGWSHDGVSPKDASRIRWRDKIPGEETEFFSTPSDPKIEITPKLKAWWIVGFRSRHNQMMNRAASLYKLTGETRYAEWAAAQLDFYADNFTAWKAPRPDQGARLYWQTLTEASNLITYAGTVRLLGDYVAPGRLARWRKNFFEPEVAVINATYRKIHNIGVWQRCAAAQVALLFGDEAMWREAIDGKYGLRAQIALGITGDYIWHEQSLGYNSYVVQAVLTLFTAAGLHGRAGTLAHEMTVAENLMLSTTAMRFPDGYTPNPSDNGGRHRAPETKTCREAYRIFPTPLGLAAAREQRDWETLLDPPADVAAAFNCTIPGMQTVLATLPPAKSANMESSRMAILCAAPWQVYFHYGQLVRSHAQAEALNYELYFNGTDISHDPGTVGYGSPLYREYYSRGANHNVPLIDGQGQDLDHALPRETGENEQPASAHTRARGELLEYFEGDATRPARVAAAQKHYRENASVTRTLEAGPVRFTDTVTIKTTDGKPHALGLALQLQGAPVFPADSPADFAPVAGFAKNRPAPFKYWRDPRAADFTDRAVFNVEYPGGLAMVVHIDLPGKFRLYRGNTPDVPPARRETIYIEQEGKTATIKTTISPAEK